VLAEAAHRRRKLYRISAGLVAGILATFGIFGWLHWRTSRCPACEHYIRHMLLTWNCPQCRARLR